MTLANLETIGVELKGDLLLATLNRPDKRNCISEKLLAELHTIFTSLPSTTRAVVLTGAGSHFSAGMDLSEHRERDPLGVVRISREWHRVFHEIQFGQVPVVSAMHGAVIGGGLELAMATHVRVADSTAFYALPEGRRGIFVGGGASVRVGKLIGADRMVEMMLTGRRYAADDGYRLGFSHYLVPEGQALSEALKLAGQIAGNAPLSNSVIMNTIGRIETMGYHEGLWVESLSAGIAQTSKDAEAGMSAFLRREAIDFRSSSEG